MAAPAESALKRDYTVVTGMARRQTITAGNKSGGGGYQRPRKVRGRLRIGEHLLREIGTASAGSCAAGATCQLGHAIHAIARGLADGLVGNSITDADVHKAQPDELRLI